MVCGEHFGTPSEVRKTPYLELIWNSPPIFHEKTAFFQQERGSTEQGGFAVWCFVISDFSPKSAFLNQEAIFPFRVFASFCRSLPFLRHRSGTHFGTQVEAHICYFGHPTCLSLTGLAKNFAELKISATP